MSVILHIPHSSTVIPERYRQTLLPDDGAIREELLAMTDLYTDELFHTGRTQLVFPISRLVCDVERFRNDADEPMSRIGMGAFYTATHRLTPLRRGDENLRREILETYYDPHHARFDELVEESLRLDGHCLIIDGHSFSQSPLPYEPEQQSIRPDICIGTDAYHTPPELAALCWEVFETHGYSTAFDFPYAGSIVPLRFYRSEDKVMSVMIELNRSLYMDAQGNKTAGFAPLRAVICEAVGAMEDLARTMLPRLSDGGDRTNIH